MDRVARINIARSPELIDSNIEVVYYYAVSMFSKNVLSFSITNPRRMFCFILVLPFLSSGRKVTPQRITFAYPLRRPEGDEEWVAAVAPSLVSDFFFLQFILSGLLAFEEDACFVYILFVLLRGPT